MFTSVEDFMQSWGYESGSTQKVMDRLTDQSLSQPVAEGHWTLGQLAWHIVTTIPGMMPHTGLKVTSLKPDAPMPSGADEIKKAYRAVSAELGEQVKSTWDDAALLAEDDMYGMKWKKGQTLDIMVKHEAHHRGQMTVLMRQAGLKVPGVYGPSKEEWAESGMEPPEM